MAIHAPFGYYAQAAEEDLLLDTYTGSLAAYSFRKLRSDYTGYAVRVAETGTNTTFDIGFDANGDLDTASADAWDASNDLVVDRWYDQSGNGDDLLCAQTPPNGPFVRIGSTWEVLNGKVMMNLNGIQSSAGDHFDITGSVETMMSTPNTPMGLFLVGRNDGTQISNVLRGRRVSSGNPIYSCTLLDTGNGQKMNYFTRNDSSVGGQRNSTSTYSINTQELWEWHYLNDSGFQIGSSYAPFFYESNTALGNTSFHSITSTITIDDGFIGGDGKENNFMFSGDMQELIIFDAFKTNSSGTGDREGIWNNIQTYYNIT